MLRMIVFLLPLIFSIQGCINFLGLPINETFAGGHEKRMLKVESKATSDMFSSTSNCLSEATWAATRDEDFLSRVTLYEWQKKGVLTAIRLIEEYCVDKFPKDRLVLFSKERDLLIPSFEREKWNPEIGWKTIKSNEIQSLNFPGGDLLDFLEFMNNRVLDELEKNPNPDQEIRTVEIKKKIEKMRCQKNSYIVAFNKKTGKSNSNDRLETNEMCNSRFAREKEEVCALCLSSLLSRFSQ